MYDHLCQADDCQTWAGEPRFKFPKTSREKKHIPSGHRRDLSFSWKCHWSPKPECSCITLRQRWMLCLCSSNLDWGPSCRIRVILTYLDEKDQPRSSNKFYQRQGSKYIFHVNYCGYIQYQSPAHGGWWAVSISIQKMRLA
jgi:hypothetical protein